MAEGQQRETHRGGVSGNRKLRIGKGRSTPDKGKETGLNAAMDRGSPSGTSRYWGHAKCF